jgi:hypothetical protein
VRNKYKVLVRRPERKRLFENPWHMWADNIKEDLKDLNQDRSIMGFKNNRGFLNSGRFLTM